MDASIGPLELPTTVVAVEVDRVLPAVVHFVAEDVQKFGVVSQDPDTVASDNTFFDDRSPIVLSMT